MRRVTAGDVAAIPDSHLALSSRRLEAGARLASDETDFDSLLYVVSGRGSLELLGSWPLTPGSAALVLAGEKAELRAAGSELDLVWATVGARADRHARLGERATVVSSEDPEALGATGARSFRVLFGPHNGSTRATLFLGFVPPGKAPWHYHLYDEIVWVPEGPGKLHLDDSVEELSARSAFRLRPREVHIVENASGDRELTVLGVFTPAGSPSAAYVTSEVAGTYRFSP